ncbi:MAG: hypothetical protein R3C05_29795 [Pirellulaceae bacterium]
MNYLNRGGASGEAAPMAIPVLSVRNASDDDEDDETFSPEPEELYDA